MWSLERVLAARPKQLLGVLRIDVQWLLPLA
jgi:hypothetical protein